MSEVHYVGRHLTDIILLIKLSFYNRITTICLSSIRSGLTLLLTVHSTKRVRHDLNYLNVTFRQVISSVLNYFKQGCMTMILSCTFVPSATTIIYPFNSFVNHGMIDFMMNPSARLCAQYTVYGTYKKLIPV
jgi:hypothetical protein